MTQRTTAPKLLAPTTRRRNLRDQGERIPGRLKREISPGPASSDGRSNNPKGHQLTGRPQQDGLRKLPKAEVASASQKSATVHAYYFSANDTTLHRPSKRGDKAIKSR